MTTTRLSDRSCELAKAKMTPRLQAEIEAMKRASEDEKIIEDWCWSFAGRRALEEGER